MPKSRRSFSVRHRLAVAALLTAAALVLSAFSPLTAPVAAAELEPFASTFGVELLPTSEQVAVIGFHEADADKRATVLNPRGEVLARGEADGPVPDGTAMVLPTRGRGTKPTTAVDLAQPSGADVTSPVDGTVTEVADYRLYGSAEDQYVVIAPAERPDLEVWVLHIARVRVQPGDEVTAGRTVLARTARTLPFRSQIERFSGTMPHVHVDVRAPR